MKTRWKILITLAFFVFLLGVGLIGFLLLNRINDIPMIGQKVAIVPIRGEITDTGCECNIFGCPECASVEDVKNMLKAADEDMSVKAIVLDINSGGGGVIPSMEMMNIVKKTKKPVVAKISDIGTSGAYLVASAADKIVADKNSITGSIGVVMYVQQYYKLMEKIGINMTVIKSGENKDIGSPYRPTSKEEEKELKILVEEVFENLVEEIAKNRNLSKEYVRSISDGSIYLGTHAKDIGLVDYVGDMDYAIEIAGKLANIKGKPGVKEILKRKTILDLLSGG